MTGSPQEVLEDSYEEEEDEVPLPHYEKVVKMAVARLDDQVGLLRGSQVNFFSKKFFEENYFRLREVYFCKNKKWITR